ncbi:MAG: hypothetical protein C4293_08450 [Nitrospiraceae bacterium]
MDFRAIVIAPAIGHVVVDPGKIRFEPDIACSEKGGVDQVRALEGGDSNGGGKEQPDHEIEPRDVFSMSIAHTEFLRLRLDDAPSSFH